MHPLPLRSRIVKYLMVREWICGAEIERLAMEKGFKASNASRRLRELHEDGLLERDVRKGRGTSTVWYKYKKPELPEYRRTESLFAQTNI